MNGSAFSWRVEQADGTTVLHLSGEIDLEAVAALDEALDGIDGVLVIDLADVSFMDSSGIRWLLKAYGDGSRRPGGVTVRNLSAPVQRVLEVAGLEDHFSQG